LLSRSRPCRNLIVEIRISDIEWKEVYYLRERCSHGTGQCVLRLTGDKNERSFAVVIGFGERRIGLLSTTLRQQEVVIKFSATI